MQLKLNSKELKRLADMVAEKTEASDFEYQDEDYQKFLNDLQDKLNEIYLEALKAQ